MPDGRHLRFAVVLALGCARQGAAPREVAPAAAALAAAESLYADLRALRDRWEVTTAAGRAATEGGEPLAALARRHDALRATLLPRLAAADSLTLGAEDRRALAVMRRAAGDELAPLGDAPPAAAGAGAAPDCAYDPDAFGATQGGADSLARRVYACYGWAQHHVMVDGERTDRLGVLAALARTDDRERRRRLFLALEPVWRSVNGDGGPASPYRRLMERQAARRRAGHITADAAADRARALGVEPDSLERWLVRILEAWRAATPDSLLEPWDWHHAAGRAARVLGPRIPVARLRRLNDSVYAALGADVRALGVRYDLAPREGKTPVAFTTFGARARRLHGGGWAPAEPWVFATYRAGGLDELNELLHETGHAVHIAAVRARPAFADWPDSDPMSEALGDFVALDVYEPRWQMRWLGDSVPLADGMRARYAGIVLDVAWALFELRVQRDPAADPNRVWSELTSTYLRIRPHPEWSWWAMRGQLVDAPGYMMNYALGAIVIAAIRDRTRALHGEFVAGDSTWYGWVAPRLFRFGLERTSRAVLSEFLGGPVRPEALLADLARTR